MYKAIIPECYIDTCLINVLSLAKEKRGVNHGKGKSSVAVKMNDDFFDEFCIGIIDKDDDSLDEINDNFYLLNNSIFDYAVLYKHKVKPHYIIQLCPESETWICNVTKQVGISLSDDYNLPDTPKSLSHVTKNVSSKYDPKFIKLFKHIAANSEQTNFEPVLKLKRWLRLLIDDNYKVDVKELEK